MLYLVNWSINAMNTLGELCTLMVIWVVEFSSGGYKIRNIFACPKEMIEFEVLD